MPNPFIKTGYKMKVWIYKIILRDFGKVSYAKGLYNIISLYEKYVPKSARKNLKGGKRINKKWI